MPIYYTNRAMIDAEKRYPSSEKLELTLVISTRKFRTEFQASTIAVVASLSLRQVLKKLVMSTRLVK